MEFLAECKSRLTAMRGAEGGNLSSLLRAGIEMLGSTGEIVLLMVVRVTLVLNISGYLIPSAFPTSARDGFGKHLVYAHVPYLTRKLNWTIVALPYNSLL